MANLKGTKTEKTTSTPKNSWNPVTTRAPAKAPHTNQSPKQDTMCRGLSPPVRLPCFHQTVFPGGNGKDILWWNGSKCRHAGAKQWMYWQMKNWAGHSGRSMHLSCAGRNQREQAGKKSSWPWSWKCSNGTSRNTKLPSLKRKRKRKDTGSVPCVLPRQDGTSRRVHAWKMTSMSRNT